MQTPVNRFLAYFEQKVGRSPLRSVSLYQYSNFRIGGKADFFFEAKTSRELIQAIGAASEFKIPFYIIGGGYNLFFHDKGFRGLIIKNSVSEVVQKEDDKIKVFSGTLLKNVIRFCIENGLCGLEFLAGIPGTLGGAVCGNAGAFGNEIGERLLEGIVLGKDGSKRQVKRDYFNFSYRSSRLKKRSEILLWGILSVQISEPEKVADAVSSFLKQREEKHPPYDTACAGSYFKNPVLPDGKKLPAARLLEEVGAKNLSIGGAAVYSGHSNFIINQGGATAEDVLNLADKLKHRVKEKFKIDLEEEVIFLPEKLSDL
jgi:UDP-N-acetylmuramate dehydrogenase